MPENNIIEKLMLGYREERIILHQEAGLSDETVPKTPLVDVEKYLDQQSENLLFSTIQKGNYQNSVARHANADANAEPHNHPTRQA